MSGLFFIHLFTFWRSQFQICFVFPASFFGGKIKCFLTWLKKQNKTFGNKHTNVKSLRIFILLFYELQRISWSTQNKQFHKNLTRQLSTQEAAPQPTTGAFCINVNISCQPRLSSTVTSKSLSVYLKEHACIVLNIGKFKFLSVLQL